MTLTLFVDVTLTGATLALVDVVVGQEPRYLATASHCENARSTAALSDLLETLLRCSGLDVGFLEQIVVASGPGSFTGIKVGIAFAQALVTGQGGRIPLMGISGLEALAICGRDDQLWLVPSTRTEGYAAFRSENGNIIMAIAVIGSSGLELLQDKTRTSVALSSQVQDWQLVQPWPQLVSSMGDARVITSNPLPIMAHKVLVAAMTCLAAPSRKELFVLGNLEPRYIRFSAPEERRSQANHGT